jgi:uncharacterized protein
MTVTTSTITALRIYPIKSCRGISLPSTTLTKQGLHLDRRWMFVDSSNRFLTIRQKPQMTLINTAIDDDSEELIITIGTDESKSVRVPLYPSDDWLSENAERVEVDIWDYITPAYAYTDPKITALFTEHLCDAKTTSVRLVVKDPSVQRICRGNAAPHILGREATVNFPDVLPVQIASEASIKELNSRLTQRGEQEITIERFRPNIIVSSNEPWDEDTWKIVRLNGDNSWLTSLTGGNMGAIDIDIQARCARCQVPNVEPSTGEKHPKQPWDTLMSYRRVDEGIKFKPCFGMLGCPRGKGRVEVGMRFEVLGRTEGHRYIKGF